jgi:hypothetical protein
MADPINANPTILNASDLPTRQTRHSQADTSAVTSLFTELPSASHISDPFEPISSRAQDSDSEDDGQIEQIDDQEIYGAHFFVDSMDLKNEANGHYNQT